MKSILFSHLVRTLVALAAIGVIFLLFRQYENDAEVDFSAYIGQFSFAELWIKFFAIYLINLLILYYGSQTLGLWRFVHSRRCITEREADGKPSFFRFSLLKSPNNFFDLLGNKVLEGFRKAGKAVLWLLLFSPSYVAAYAVKSNLNTESVFFMIVLGCLTNGILILYGQKFFSLLLAEYRKGYTETAQVHAGLKDFNPGTPSGLRWRAILGWPKHFGNHPLEAIYQNARRQYLSSFREQAAFLITCMMMIEMALNIHGFMGYELLRSLLLRDYTSAALMIGGIFVIVKITQIGTDYLLYAENRNRSND